MKFKIGDEVRTNSYFKECCGNLPKFRGTVESVDVYKQLPGSGRITNLVMVSGRGEWINEAFLEFDIHYKTPKQLNPPEKSNTSFSDSTDFINMFQDPITGEYSVKQ